MSGRLEACSILDVPDEILIDIILYLNARERLALSKTSRKLNTLIFNEPKLLRNLDFSEDGYLTLMSDVQEYFTEKIKLEHIQAVNVSGIYSTQPRGLVLQSICRAEKLVDVNISGFKFQDTAEFKRFLKPLKLLKKLAIDWPTHLVVIMLSEKHFGESFGRLTHLSVTLHNPPDKFTLIHSLEMCPQLEELRLLQTYRYFKPPRSSFWMKIPDKLQNLRIVACCGTETEFISRIIKDMLPDPEQWTKLNMFDSTYTPYFYYERNLQVTEQLKDTLCKDYWPEFPFYSSGWCLRFITLLEAVFRINKHTASKRFCCLSYLSNMLLTIEDTKMMLKNPAHQISYLNIRHDIEPECDIHLIASYFPKLTKLVLCNVIKVYDFPPEETIFETGCKRKRTASEERNETVCHNLCFKKLVDNTPGLRDLTLCARSLSGHDWDLSALYLIAGWKSLTTLFLANIPIENGQFLVVIAKQCTNLEKLRLEDLGPRRTCCYKDELLQMLNHCHNLKDFSIQQYNLPKVADIFKTLARNPKVRRVRVESLGRVRGVQNLVPHIEMLASCCNLILLICEIKGMTQPICDKITDALNRLKVKLNRPNFHFEVIQCIRSEEPSRNLSLDLVNKDLILSQRFTDAIHRLDCA